MATDLEPQTEETEDLESEDVGLTDRQVQALERLDELGGQPAEFDEETGKYKYHSDQQIRALQLIAQGRLGGPGRGQGRKSTKHRLADELSSRLARKADKMEKVIDRALADDSSKIAMDAVRLSVDIQEKAIKQRIAEERHEAELESLDKGELVGEIISLFTDPLVSAALRGEAKGRSEAVITLPQGAVEEVHEPEVNRADDSDPAHAQGNGDRDDRSARGSRRGQASSPSRKAPNPWAKAAGRRAAN